MFIAVVLQVLPSDPGHWGFMNGRSSGKCHPSFCLLLSSVSVGIGSEMDTYREERGETGLFL